MPKEKIYKFNHALFRRLVRERGIKQCFIADQCHVGRTCVSGWISGRFCPTPGHLARLAAILNVPAKQFIDKK